MIASFQRNGRVMIPISVASPMKEVRAVFQISGMGRNKNMMAVRLLLWIEGTSCIRCQTGAPFN
jgi:hypothetical protein